MIQDRHLLYEAAVQSPDADLDFFRKVYRKANRKPLKTLREDFCGTAALAVRWVKRGRDHQAWGVDLDQATLDWGIERYVPGLSEKKKKNLHLRCADVRDVAPPKVELVCALNFSYGVFHTREALREYFTAVRGSLKPGGVFVLDAFGGTDAMDISEEDREIESTDSVSGIEVPEFTYVWEQAKFNVVDHSMTCYIHFELADGTRMEKAFRYDWRVWTFPELTELLKEAGFSDAGVYMEGWDEEEEDGDGKFKRRTFFENQEGWVGYVVGFA